MKRKPKQKKHTSMLLIDVLYLAIDFATNTDEIDRIGMMIRELKSGAVLRLKASGEDTEIYIP